MCFALLETNIGEPQPKSTDFVSEAETEDVCLCVIIIITGTKRKREITDIQMEKVVVG